MSSFSLLKFNCKHTMAIKGGLLVDFSVLFCATKTFLSFIMHKMLRSCSALSTTMQHFVFPTIQFYTLFAHSTIYFIISYKILTRIQRGTNMGALPFRLK